MAEDRVGDARPQRPRLDKEARRAERARINRLSRLPGLYELAERGTAGVVLAGLLQVSLALVLTLVPLRLLTGEWLPRSAALVVLAVAFGLQFLARYLNARAGRR